MPLGLLLLFVGTGVGLAVVAGAAGTEAYNTATLGRIAPVTWLPNGQACTELINIYYGLIKSWQTATPEQRDGIRYSLDELVERLLQMGCIEGAPYWYHIEYGNLHNGEYVHYVHRKSRGIGGAHILEESV